jgi:hypothetical protein
MSFKSVNYSQLIPLLVAGFNEQAALAESNLNKEGVLRARLQKLEYDLAILKDKSLNGQIHQQPELKNNGNVRINPNVPNPFDTQTRIEYTIEKEGLVRAEILDSKGSMLVTLVNENQKAGQNLIIWDATSFSSGVYFLVIRSNGDLHVQKLVKR